MIEEQTYYKKVGDNYEEIPNLDEYTGDKYKKIGNSNNFLKVRGAPGDINQQVEYARKNKIIENRVEEINRNVNLAPTLPTAVPVRVSNPNQSATFQTAVRVSDPSVAVQTAVPVSNSNPSVDVQTVFPVPVSNNPPSPTPSARGSTPEPNFNNWKLGQEAWSETFREKINEIYKPEIKYLNWRYTPMKENTKINSRDEYHVLDIFKIDDKSTGKPGEKYVKTFGTFIKGNDNTPIATVQYLVKDPISGRYIKVPGSNKFFSTDVQFPYELIWKNPTIGEPNFFKSKLAYNPKGGRKTKRRKTNKRKTNKRKIKGRKTKGRKTKGRKTKGRKTTRRRR